MELITQVEFARRTGRSPSSINKLIKAGKLPKKKGKLEYKKCLKIIESMSVQNTGGRPKKIPVFGEIEGDNSEAINLELAMKKARLASETWKGMIAELDYSVKNKNVFTVEDIRETIEQTGASIRERFLTMSAKLARSLEGKKATEIKIILQDEINEIMTEIYELSGNVVDV